MSDIAQSERLVEAIRPLLAGNPPGVQGLTLVQLLAIWLASHPDFMRARLLTTHRDAVLHLVPVIELELFGERGHPNNRGTDT